MKRGDTDELQCLMMGSSVGTVRCITELLRVGPTANLAASSTVICEEDNDDIFVFWKNDAGELVAVILGNFVARPLLFLFT